MRRIVAPSQREGFDDRLQVSNCCAALARSARPANLEALLQPAPRSPGCPGKPDETVLAAVAAGVNPLGAAQNGPISSRKWPSRVRCR